MEKYNAWIKELSTIVYDNSKSEYQILSELIPILLNIKSSQDTNSELMDTIHDTVFNKVNELESDMNTFTETFIGKLNEYKEEFTPQLEEFTTTLESNIKEFKEKINNKISSFNTTYASEKASIQTIADSINNINDTLISGYNEILDKINNFVEPIINSASGNIINSAIEEKFTPTYLARESIYIDLVSVTTAPSSANEGDIYYNASEYQLYKYTGGAWVEEEYTTNKIYRYQNNLYYITAELINGQFLSSVSQAWLSKGKEGYFIGMAGNAGRNLKINVNNINGGIEQFTPTLPTNFANNDGIYQIIYSSNDNKYYVVYSGKPTEEYPDEYDFIGSSTDDLRTIVLENIFPANYDVIDKIQVFNGIMYCGCYKYINGNWVKIPYSILGYFDNKYWRAETVSINNRKDSKILYATNDEFTDEVEYCTIDYNPSRDDFNFYYKNDLMIYYRAIINNKEVVGYMTNDEIYYTDNTILQSGNLVSNKNNIYLLPNNINIISGLSYNNYLILSYANSTLRYNVGIALVAYEQN